MCGTSAQSSKSVHDLGLQMKQHVNKVASICYYQLRRLLQVWMLHWILWNLYYYSASSHRQLQFCSRRPQQSRHCASRIAYCCASCLNPFLGLDRINSAWQNTSPTTHPPQFLIVLPPKSPFWSTIWLPHISLASNRPTFQHPLQRRMHHRSSTNQHYIPFRM